MKKTLSFVILLMLVSFGMMAQETVQMVRGRVTDNVTGAPLAGIAVIANMNGYLTCYTDEEGYYRIPNVPVGFITLSYSCVGYETIAMDHVPLNAGKELIMNIKMQEDVALLEGVVVRAERDRLKAVNDMGLVSARAFSPADAERYAGSMNDISRMAQNMAGVGSPDDSSNDIVVRGNSPFGLLWRLEGVDIYNPNHFSDGGSTGGPISMVNVNTLAASDIYMSAFPAEYMNAYSGAFDIRLRAGNDENYEFTGQVGINGVEAICEGPFSKKSHASFLASYRYSFLGVLSALGFDFGTGSATPTYQDWTAKVNIPTKNFGTFSAFTLGGFANISMAGGESTFYNYADNIDSHSEMVVMGASHEIQFGRNSQHSLRTALSFSNSEFSAQIDTVNSLAFTRDRSQDALLLRQFASLQFTYNYKISPKLSLRAGAVGKRLAYRFVSSDYSNVVYPKDVNEIGSTYQLQGYGEFLYRPKPWLTFNVGVNSQLLTLNNSWNIDPRFGVSFKYNNKHEFSIGYGLHSQIQGLEIYMTKLFTQSQDSKIYPNRYLNMTHAHHFVLGYQWRINKSTRFKTELYYQMLYDLPVDLYEPYYSTINLGGLDFDKYGRVYISSGTGKNYGLEFTLERTITDGWYYLATLSLFESKFTSLDNIERNTRYNGNYVGNVLVGKEFYLSKKPDRKNIWSFGGDVKTAFAGGQRYIPVDVEASRAAGTTIYIYEQAYEPQFPFYMRIDVKAWLKVHQKNITHELGIEVRNLTDRANIYDYRYDVNAGDVITTYQTGLLPLGYYRITF